MTDGAFELTNLGAVLFDLDGTVYYGPTIIPGANETIRFFRAQGIPVFFATNNSTKTRKQIFEKLVGMGIDCRQDEVLTSGYLAAQYAKSNGYDNIYVFGSKNLEQEFTEVGITVSHDEDADNLIIGYDPDMTYEDLTKAVRVALHAKLIMACNRERVFPGKDAKLMPGCGAMTAPIEWCANRECDLVIGKPNPMMIEYIAEFCKAKVSDVLMVGDTYESDIRMAFLAGCKAVLISNEQHEGVATIPSIAELPSLFPPA